MGNDLQVLLKCKNDEIFVECNIHFNEPVEGFVFSINALLGIDDITGNPDITFSKLREWNPTFRAACHEISISASSPMTSLTIKYHGRVSGWANIVEERRIALSSYSAWYPQETSIPLDTTFTMLDMEEYFMLNASYSESNKAWHYGASGHDVGNIIALKNGEYHSANTSNFTFYYINEKEKIVAGYLLHYYNDIIAYYNRLFGCKELKKFDIVSLGKSNGGGAYFRKELVVAEHMGHNLDDEKAIQLDAASMLAHELGHNWFLEADTDSWEDWLNETGATWASILYAIDTNNDELFGRLMDWPQNNYLKAPVIKSPDGSRPSSGVHERGTMMLYELYSSFGVNVIVTILQTLIEIKEKTTESLLASLRAKIGDSVPDLIEKGLLLEEYSSLRLV